MPHEMIEQRKVLYDPHKLASSVAGSSVAANWFARTVMRQRGRILSGN